MSDADNAFTHATDNLIALYRSIERSALDLPLVSFMPFIIFIWWFLKFYFFFFIGIFLIIPINLVILVRNFFPGHWRYRPFFLRHLYYTWLWIWQGEAPTAPFIFVRPLLNVFIKGHFERQLRRLRLEILLRDGLSDATRSSLRARIDAALELWKSPRYTAIFFTGLLPVVITFPSWYKGLIDFLGLWDIQVRTDVVVNFVSNISPENLLYFFSIGLAYLLGVPVTSFLAKRGLFIGREPERICFPGGQGGSGAYLKEKEILGNVGLRAREIPIDLWLLGAGTVISVLSVPLSLQHSLAEFRSQIHSLNLNPQSVSTFESQVEWFVYGFPIGLLMLFIGLLTVAALRRRTTGRA